MDIGWQELLLVLVVAFLAFGFGTGRVPQIAKTLGQGVGSFRREAEGASGIAEAAPARPVATRADEV